MDGILKKAADGQRRLKPDFESLLPPSPSGELDGELESSSVDSTLRMILRLRRAAARKQWKMPKQASTTISELTRVGSTPRRERKRLALSGKGSTPGASTMTTLLCSSLLSMASKP